MTTKNFDLNFPQKPCFPIPTAWARVHKAMRKYSEVNVCNPQNPPSPLILGGWAFSTDLQKIERWEDFKLWAKTNGCLELVDLVASELLFLDQE
jgi:hypothetical protein